MQRQLRAQMTAMDGGNAVFAGAKNCPIYTPVFDFGFLRRSTSCIHAVVRALLPCIHEKIRMNRGTQ